MELFIDYWGIHNVRECFFQLDGHNMPLGYLRNTEFLDPFLKSNDINTEDGKKIFLESGVIIDEKPLTKRHKNRIKRYIKNLASGSDSIFLF
jgi:hypothetical protein